jgi:phage I-like protein
MNSATLIALNADSPLANGNRWVHVLPSGRFTGLDGRAFDAEDLEGIVLASRDYAGQRQMVVDYNHGTDLLAAKGHDAPAAGWIVGLQVRGDGVWGLVEWTAKAAQHLAAREYRYLSPVIAHNRDGRVTRILRASLTNTPNLDQLTALASAAAEGAHSGKEQPMEFLAKIAALLGLEAGASEDAIIAALEKRLTATNSAEPDPTKFVPIGDFQRVLKEANKLRQGVSQNAAEERVDEQIRKGVILPWMRDWGVSLCMANLPAFDDFITGCGPGFSRLTGTLMPNGKSQPGGAADRDPLLDEIAANMGLDPKEFAAFNAAQDNQG